MHCFLLRSALVFPRGEQYGGPMTFQNFEQLEQAFQKEVRIREEEKKCSTACLCQEVHPGDLKNGVAGYLNRLLEPIRKEFASEEMQQLILNAYPPPPAPVQVKKSESEENMLFSIQYGFSLEKQSGGKGKPEASASATTVSELEEAISEDLAISTSTTTDQNGQH